MKRTIAWIAGASILLLLTGCEPGAGPASSAGENSSGSSQPSQNGEIPESGMNMKGFEFVIQDMTSENGKVTVSTPTSTFAFTETGVALSHTTEEGDQRALALFTFPESPENAWSAEYISDYEVKVTSGKISAWVYGDSVARFRGLTQYRLADDGGAFDPEFRYTEDSGVIFADEEGGVAMYGPRGAKLITQGMETGGAFSALFNNVAENLVREASVREGDGDDENDLDVLVSVFPPKRFDYEKYAATKIAHYFGPLEDTSFKEKYQYNILSTHPVPDKEELEELKNNGFNVLVLHLEAFYDFCLPGILPLGAVPSQNSPVPVEVFVDCVTQAKANGMKVLLYTSPFYFESRQKPHSASSVDHFIKEGAGYLLTIMSEKLGRDVTEDIDGLYYDGNFMGIEKAWQAVRETRKLLGPDKLLYLHNTQMPMWNPRMPVPFIDTYADYTLRGESFQYPITDDSESGDNLTRAIDASNYGLYAFDPLYFRYVISGYNMGNQIGTLCYENTRIDDMPPEKGGVIRTVIEDFAGIPFWNGFQKNPWSYFLYQSFNGERGEPGKANFFWGDEETRYLTKYLPVQSTVTSREANPYYTQAKAVREQYVEDWRKEMSRRRAEMADYLQKQTQADPDKANLAGGKPIQYSSRAPWDNESGQMPHLLGPTAEYAVDNNPDTFYRLENSPGWVEIDLQDTYEISRLVMNNVVSNGNDNTHPNDFGNSPSNTGDRLSVKIKVSEDGVNYTQVYMSRGFVNPIGGGDTYTFDKVKARYVRVILSNDVKEFDTWRSVYIKDLRIYED